MDRQASSRHGRLRVIAGHLPRSCQCLKNPAGGIQGSCTLAEWTRKSAPPTRRQLLRSGFCVVPDILPSDLLQRLRTVTDAALDGQSEEARERHRSQGSMIAIPGRDRDAFVDPAILELLTLQPALDALVDLGYPAGAATFTDGYVISKPERSPPLFWHYDWFSWELEEDWEPTPPQVFFMYYLHSTSPENGCLRAIPRSHYIHNDLR